MAYFIFIAFGFVLTACSWLKPKLAPYCGVMFFIYAVLFAGMRGASMDYDNYVSMFQAVATSTEGLWQKLELGKDPIFGALIVLIHSVGLNAQWLFMASALAALAMKAKAFQRAFGSIITPMFVLVCGSYFLHEFTQIRVAIALGFSFVALIELCEGRKFLWLVFSLIALGFHASILVVIAFELPLVFGVRSNFWVIISALFGLFSIDFMGNLLAVISNFESRTEAYEGLANVTDHMMIVASAKLAGLSLLTFFVIRGGVREVEGRILKVSCLFAYVGYGFMLIFMGSASGFGFRIYELFDAFSVFIVAGALLKKKTLPWSGGLVYCMALVLLLVTSKLLLPYEMADAALW